MRRRRDIKTEAEVVVSSCGALVVVDGGVGVGTTDGRVDFDAVCHAVTDWHTVVKQVWCNDKEDSLNRRWPCLEGREVQLQDVDLRLRIDADVYNGGARGVRQLPDVQLPWHKKWYSSIYVRALTRLLY